MKKLVVLDHITEETHLIPYDTNVYEDAIECIIAYQEYHGFDSNINDISFMEVSEFKLIIL